MPTKEEILNAEHKKFIKKRGIESIYPPNFPGAYKEAALNAMEEYDNRDKWISVKDAPLFTTDEQGNWTCTEDGDGEFFAAVPYKNVTQPNEELWWIRHCVIEDETGLCIVSDEDNEPAGWNMKDVTFYQPIPKPPKQW